jgi:hypothetical protein
MGFFFDIKSSNIVGYLTTSNRRRPRVTPDELRTFLGNFTEFAPPLFSEVLISSSPQWIEAVKRAGAKTYQDLKETAKVDLELTNWGGNPSLRQFYRYTVSLPAPDNAHLPIVSAPSIF